MLGLSSRTSLFWFCTLRAFNWKLRATRSLPRHGNYLYPIVKYYAVMSIPAHHSSVRFRGLFQRVVFQSLDGHRPLRANRKVSSESVGVPADQPLMVRLPRINSVVDTSIGSGGSADNNERAIRSQSCHKRRHSLSARRRGENHAGSTQFLQLGRRHPWRRYRYKHPLPVFLRSRHSRVPRPTAATR